MRRLKSTGRSSSRPSDIARMEMKRDPRLNAPAGRAAGLHIQRDGPARPGYFHFFQRGDYRFGGRDELPGAASDFRDGVYQAGVAWIGGSGRGSGYDFRRPDYVSGRKLRD